jgi:2-keto-4-pentenoate hydratase/2-oxohepta-3-ene-1,7-dioic acid hydratase in catechol pathway
VKLLRFDAGRGPVLGALSGDHVVDLLTAARTHIVGGVSGQDAAFEPWFSPEMTGLINGGPAALHNARQAVKAALAITAIAKVKGGPLPAGVHAAKAVQVLAPLPAPSKIICVGQNYMDHIREQNAEVPKTPILFSKAPTSIIGPGEPIRWSKGLTEQADLEVELGVVIGTRMSGVPASKALDHVFGYTVLNDVSARDLQFGDKQWVRGKSLDRFCPIGPVIVTRDEVADPQALRLTSSCNGRVWQDSNTKEMIFPIATLLEFICRGITLLPGDLIASGTPHGVGCFQKPPVYLAAGDKLRLEVEGIGVLENPVEGGV